MDAIVGCDWCGLANGRVDFLPPRVVDFLMTHPATQVCRDCKKRLTDEADAA